MSKFLNAMQSHNSSTWNGAVSHSTSGDSILDYFAKAGSYRNRTQSEVDADMASIFGEDEELALKAVLYNRMITRKCKGFVEETSLQKGQGQKDEFLKSLNWLERNRPELLEKNLWLTAEVGSWKDLVNAYLMGLDVKWIYPLLRDGINDSYHRGLIAKFLPKIRSRRNTKNDRHKRLNLFGRGFAEYMGWSEKNYREFKSDPENSAHQFQRDMCSENWKGIDINTIPGKALFRMVSQKGRDGKSVFGRHNLEGKLIQYVKSHPVKFNGYPYELLQAAKGDRTLVQTHTYNAQFDSLVKKAKEECNPELLAGGVLCALDTSGSMGYLGHYGYGTSVTQPIDVCVGLGLYFSSLIEGHFKNHVCMFDNTSRIIKLNGTFCDKVDQVKRQAVAWGGTNFQSVIDEIVRVRKQNPSIPVEEFPKTLLVVSDMQFNPAGGNDKTNYEMASTKLRNVGLPEMNFIWWNVNGRYTRDVPVKKDDKGTMLLSGMDGAVLSMFFSKDVQSKTPKQLTPLEAMHQALDQEILNLVEV